MIGDFQKLIIIRALRIRQARGEEPTEVLDTYKNLTEAEKVEILERLLSH